MKHFKFNNAKIKNKNIMMHLKFQNAKIKNKNIMMHLKFHNAIKIINFMVHHERLIA